MASLWPDQISQGQFQFGLAKGMLWSIWLISIRLNGKMPLKRLSEFFIQSTGSIYSLTAHDVHWVTIEFYSRIFVLQSCYEFNWVNEWMVMTLKVVPCASWHTQVATDYVAFVRASLNSALKSTEVGREVKAEFWDFLKIKLILCWSS